MSDEYPQEIFVYFNLNGSVALCTTQPPPDVKSIPQSLSVRRYFVSPTPVTTRPLRPEYEPRRYLSGVGVICFKCPFCVCSWVAGEPEIHPTDRASRKVTCEAYRYRYGHD